MMAKKTLPHMARSMPRSRTSAARREKRSTSSFLRPNSLTSSAPPMLSVSFIIAFMAALASICPRAISRSRPASERAARMKSGIIITLISVSRHSMLSITISMADSLDGVGDHGHDGVADGILRADHVVVQAAHQLAHARVGEEAQRHALQARVQGHPQIVGDAFAHPRVQPPVGDVDRAAQDGQDQQRRPPARSGA